MAPRCTRLTAVLCFNSKVPLYMFDHPIGLMSPNSLRGSFSIPQQVFEENKIYFSSISSSLSHHIEGSDFFYYIKISFWIDSSATPVHSVSVPIPNSWTPRIYLAALNISIRRQKLLISAPDNTMGSSLPRLNEVHWLFAQPTHLSLRMLDGKHAFGQVNGGESVVLTT
jgi:hypothetical protein